VALKRIEVVPFTYRWSGEGSITEELFPDTFKLEKLEKLVGQTLTRRRIRFESPLDKGKEAEYTMVLKCKQDGMVRSLNLF
jgi:hypothetical protein